MRGVPTMSQPPSREVRYARVRPGHRSERGDREITDVAELTARLERGDSPAGWRLQGLDLRAVADRLLSTDDVHGLVVLGGVLTPELDEHLRRHGAIIFPADTRAPIRPYRGQLYTAEELYDGLLTHGYRHTPDAQAYAWFQDAELRHDAYISVLRAIHDDAMSDALVDVVDGRTAVGVMGGHAWARGTAQFEQAAALGHALADRGALVLTGGGPGAMEAANLGAACHDLDLLAPALAELAQVPHFDPDIGPWASAAFRARRLLTPRQADATAGSEPTAPSRGPREADATAGSEPAAPSRGPREAPPGRAARTRQLRSVGIPTWYYGHEPPNVFGELIAKFFSNALREDLLLHHSTGGLVVLPGAAGTVQEVFQMATRQYYEVDGRVPPIVLVGVEHWTSTLPVWPLLQALAGDRPMRSALHLVDDAAEVPDLLLP